MTKTYELNELILNNRHLSVIAEVEFDDGTPRWVDVTEAIEWTNEGNTENVLAITEELEAEVKPFFIAHAEADEYAPTAEDAREEAREASQLNALDNKRGK
jgi:hypothetical protein